MKKVLAIALVGAGILVPIAHGAGKSPATIRFDSISQRSTASGTETVYAGRVSSHDLQCKGERRVIVFQQLPGDDALIGSTKSKAPSAGASWLWKVIDPGKGAVGTYYARANPTRVCRAARSENFTIG